MSLPLSVRTMAPSELPLVRTAWKMMLRDQRHRERWGHGLDGGCFWDLINHVIDRITLPSCGIYVGCTFSEPNTPLCWAAVRCRIENAYDLLYIDARPNIRKDPVLAAALQRKLCEGITETFGHGLETVPFNPFQELRR